MLYSFVLMDKSGTAALRQSERPAHRAYLAEVRDQIAVAGPLFDDDGLTMKGSLLVIEFDSRHQAEAWLALEPFMKAGLFASVAVHRFANLWPQRSGFPDEGA